MQNDLKDALVRLLDAIRALGDTPPGRKDTYFEAPLLETDDGVFRWEELDRAGKQARAALASVGTHPEGQDGEAGLVRSMGDAVPKADAQTQSPITPNGA